MHERAGGRTKEADFVHRAGLESLLYCSFASVQAKIFAVSSRFLVCSLQSTSDHGQMIAAWSCSATLRKIPQVC